MTNKITSPTKTERLTLLMSTAFKAFLTAEAKAENISMSELVRTRCERKPDADEALLASLVLELRGSVSIAKKSLQSGMDEAQSLLAELAAKRAVPQAARGAHTTLQRKSARAKQSAGVLA